MLYIIISVECAIGDLFDTVGNYHRLVCAVITHEHIELIDLEKPCILSGRICSIFCVFAGLFLFRNTVIGIIIVRYFVKGNVIISLRETAVCIIIFFAGRNIIIIRLGIIV